MHAAASNKTLAAASVFLVLSACGGGGDVVSSGPEASPAGMTPAPGGPQGAATGAFPAAAEFTAAVAPEPVAAVGESGQSTAAGTPAGGPSVAQRASAATATAQSTANACNTIRPFYWQIGNKDARLASGALAGAGGTVSYGAATPMAVASSSKWLYAAYIAQRQGGVLSAMDRQFLTMRGGYVSFTSCTQGQTVDGCLAYQGNGAYTREDDGKFYYDSGNYQKHASLAGLGSMNNRALAAALRGQLGTDIPLVFAQPRPDGGLVMTPDAYAVFLRKIISGQLAMSGLLGSGAACTNPLVCGHDQAVFTPVPLTESWHYSMGHWVEDDPVVGDGAFSSAGSFGFYPWIDASKTYYGIVARVGTSNSGYASAQCGRLIRKAWVTGVAP
jgi:hypothetical protein